MTLKQPTIFFDGHCNLCSRAVQFILPRDRLGYFKLAPLSGETANKHLPNELIENANSIIVLNNGQLFTKSEAAFEIAGYLNGWKWIRVFRILPKGVSNMLYNFIARNRYRVFGKRTTCFLPSADWANRFLP